ncbi:MAG: EexN family lipoprotein [Gammaproteobacteria bacterium]|nr:EexN family lipoprotein [Gammaproteobacteria bacterium]MDH5302545.1 EexN family lipoprotein [Gammaproteobacteria bacterium]MDH5321024.1 EexN family lipoprotein [Gammaproteobacteria bacterium]
MFKNYAPLLLCSAFTVQGCGPDHGEARSVQEFLDNPLFLEAAVVRCSQNRSETRYAAECVNARQAVSIIEAREERARRDLLEAESELKRDALRRTQAAAAEARRRAAEAEQLRKEAEYLAQFGITPPPATDSDEPLKANVPGAVIPAANSSGQSAPSQQRDDTPPVIFEEPVRPAAESIPATDGGNAPAVRNDQAADNIQPDLDAVREELRRRQDGDSQ